jgi:hypothetical protein
MYACAAGSPTNEFAFYELFFYDYLSTLANKNFQFRGGQRNLANSFFFYDGYQNWHPATPASITRIDVAPTSGNFVAGSRVTLWLEN